MDEKNEKVTETKNSSNQAGFDYKKLSVVIPVYNEEHNIVDVLRRVRNVVGPDAEVIVVDDGSSDSTASLVEKTGVRLIRHPYNKGNGAAVKTGIRNASRRFVLLMDGDGQHPPEAIPKLVKRIENYDMLVGARDDATVQTRGRKLYNKSMNAFAGYIAGRRIYDLTSGFRVARRKVARAFLHLLPNSFSYPTTITLSMIKAGYSVDFVPLTFDIRMGRSKIRPFRDGLRFLIILLRVATLFAPMRVFLPISIFFILAGMLYYLYTFITWHRFTNLALLLLVTGIIVFLLGLVAEQISLLRFERVEDETE